MVFLDAVGIRRASLVGHSLGSFIARRVAETRPDRVARLVLISSAVTATNKVLVGVQASLRTLQNPVPAEFARQVQASSASVLGLSGQPVTSHRCQVPRRSSGATAHSRSRCRSTSSTIRSGSPTSRWAISTTGFISALPARRMADAGEADPDRAVRGAHLLQIHAGVRRAWGYGGAMGPPTPVAPWRRPWVREAWRQDPEGVGS